MSRGTGRSPTVQPEMTRSEVRTPGNQVVLIGMMGAGKTTVGRLLAHRLGWDFWDNDEALRRATGRTAAEEQRLGGADGLHATENRLLREALTGEKPTVFAAAASVVLDPETLRGVVTVWLRASAAREAENIAHSRQHHRPLPADAASALERLSEARLPLYVRLADITVDVAAEATETCERVIEALALRERKRHSPPAQSPDLHDVD
jgi:shikimate kinase